MEGKLFSQSFLMLGVRHLVFSQTGGSHGRSCIFLLQTGGSLRVKTVSSPSISASSPLPVLLKAPSWGKAQISMAMEIKRTGSLTP